MGWDVVWQLAMKQFNAEAVEVRLLILIVAAFCALMILIGLRHAFRPAGPRFASPPPSLPRRLMASPPQAVTHVEMPPLAVKEAAKPVLQPSRVSKAKVRVPRKSAKRTISAHTATRPQIRRFRTTAKSAP